MPSRYTPSMTWGRKTIPLPYALRNPYRTIQNSNLRTVETRILAFQLLKDGRFLRIQLLDFTYSSGVRIVKYLLRHYTVFLYSTINHTQADPPRTSQDYAQKSQKKFYVRFLVPSCDSKGLFAPFSVSTWKNVVFVLNQNEEGGGCGE